MEFAILQPPPLLQGSHFSRVHQLHAPSRLPFRLLECAQHRRIFITFPTAGLFLLPRPFQVLRPGPSPLVALRWRPAPLRPSDWTSRPDHFRTSSRGYSEPGLPVATLLEDFLRLTCRSCRVRSHTASRLLARGCTVPSPHRCQSVQQQLSEVCGSPDDCVLLTAPVDRSIVTVALAASIV